MTDEMKAIVQRVNELLAIDQTKLDQELLRQTKIFSDIQQVYLREVATLRDKNALLDKLKLERWHYYMGKAPASVYKKEPMNYTILKTDIDKYLAADDMLCQAKANVGMQEDLVKFLEDAMKRVQGRGYEIKASMDWQKWIAGGN